jgi:von Willebrand factor type A domain
MTFDVVPEYWWQIWIAGAVLVSVALGFVLARWKSARWIRVRGNLGGSSRTRTVVASLTAATSLFFAAALCGPALVRRAGSPRFHVVVLIDVSDSVLRADGGWKRVRSMASNRLRHAFRAWPVNTTAEVTTFRSETVSAGSERPLKEIAGQVDGITESAFATGPGTNIADGLRRAGDAIDRAGGRGAVILVSDGNETDGDGVAAAARLAARGIAVHVLPLAGGPPVLGIVSANLPPYVEAGAETFARGVLSNAAERAADGSLELRRHALAGDEDKRSAVARPSQTRSGLHLASRQWAQFRTPVLFERPGLQFVDIAVTGNGPAHRRRLFTHVERPPRLLVIGDDLWTRAFADGSMLFVRKPPVQVTTSEALEDFDGIVIDSVPANAFADGVLEKIAQVVQRRGAGLFVINGRHLDSPRDATNLMSYDGTPLEKLLPLVSQARLRAAEPPPRHVVLLIDTSGSMCGMGLTQAQQIAVYVVERFLRPQDLLDLMAFTTTASAVLTGQPMNADGRTRASQEIRRMACDGGTDPTAALRMLAARKLTNCGLLFFSDGGFAPLQQLSEYRPDCRMTVFGIRSEPFAASEPIRALADPIQVGANFDPSRINIPYFAAQARDRYFEPGPYAALSMRRVLPNGAALNVPAIPLDGSATTSAKPDVVPIAVRPKLADPVLAYKQSGAGYVGEWTTALPDSWISREDGRAAVRQWIGATLPLIDARRYVFQLTQRGEEVDLEIALSPQHDRLPAVDHIEAFLDSPGSAAVSIAMRRDERAPATFHGRIAIPSADRSSEATLVLRESGPDALTRPQRIAILLPPKTEVDGRRVPESFSFGSNEDVLRRIAQQGNGTYDALERMATGDTVAADARIDLWPFVAALGCACYLAGIFFRRIDP